MCKKNAREVVAIKCVNKKNLNKASVENLLTEIEILKNVRHPHIWDKEFIYLIMEYCAGEYLPSGPQTTEYPTEFLGKTSSQAGRFWVCTAHVPQGREACAEGFSTLHGARDGMQSAIRCSEALFGRPPFASKSFTELEEKIRSSQPVELPSRPRLSPECRDLLQRLLQRDPQQRISFQAFFAHPFVDMEHMPSAESLGKAMNGTPNGRKLSDPRSRC
ncbi:Serine/threonine-protein kinase ULK3, partial [Ophiophagus hannah]